MIEAKHLEKNNIRKWLFAIAAVLLLVVLAAEILFGKDLRAKWKDLEQAEAEMEQRIIELERQEAELQELEKQQKELNEKLNDQLEINSQLQKELEAESVALKEAEQAVEANRQDLEAKIQEIIEIRQSLPSSYSYLYPNMYAMPAALESQMPANTVYLTFDDGPSARTAEVLDILKENDIKATFFVTGQTSDEAKALMCRIVEEGHTIAVHTYSHQYAQIYASVEAYLKDFNRIYTLIYETTGVYPQIFRFPGGSINGYNKETYKAIIKEMDRRGFPHYDWNALNGDSEGVNYTVEEMTQKALAKVGAKHVIVLMHDNESKYKTVECLQGVIDGYRDAGYNFARLTPEIKAITYD